MFRIVAVTIGLALVAAACSSNAETTAGDSTNDEVVSDDSSTTTTEAAEPETTTTEATTTTVEPTTTTTTEPLVDSVAWVPCGDLDCATVQVPADYFDDSLGTLDIAINRLPAADPGQRIGVLLVNPGGPGAPGKSLAEAFSFGGFPQEITDRFDIIGFDPRGVGESEPTFACGASGEQLQVLSGVEDLFDTPEEIELGEQAVQLCVDSMGPVAGRIHTDYVVRDMDEIRKAMGEEQISFLGYSYGSLIGSWYATLFPNNVRSLVIDGADNPLDEDDTFEQRLESAREEIQPIEDLLGEALGACVDTSCPIFNDGDPVAFFLRAMEKSGLINTANANNESAAFLSVITPLYSEADWPELWDGVALLEEQDDPSVFSDLLTFQLGDDPGAVNITGHINCLDDWTLFPEKTRDVRLEETREFFEIEDQLDEEFPLLAAIEGDPAGACTFFDTIAPPALEVPFDGGGVPILVIGNTSDPVTSFGESEELANETLSNGILLEVDHQTHTVFPSNSCVNEAVVAFFLDGEEPAEGTVCAREDTDLSTILFTVCVQIAPNFDQGLSADETEEVCEEFVEQAFDRVGEETIDAALSDPDDFEAGEQVIAVLLDVLDAR